MGPTSSYWMQLCSTRYYNAVQARNGWGYVEAMNMVAWEMPDLGGAHSAGAFAQSADSEAALLNFKFQYLSRFLPLPLCVWLCRCSPWIRRSCSLTGSSNVTRPSESSPLRRIPGEQDSKRLLDMICTVAQPGMKYDVGEVTTSDALNHIMRCPVVVL